MSQIPFARPKFSDPIAAPVAPNAKSLLAPLEEDTETSLSSSRVQIGQKGLFVRRSSEGVFLRKIWKIEQATVGAEVCIDWVARVSVLLNHRSHILWIERRNPENDRFITITCRSKPTISDRQATAMIRLALLDVEFERCKKAAEKSAEAEVDQSEGTRAPTPNGPQRELKEGCDHEI
ncbi:hypothetical protein [Rhizobium jaguaris]|uniref:Uncharacterized protein n=1 Tax=Rhizobium jaguaris TaxID=1312183 RepID=A0A387FNP8_9HYPH|nr:hypothetical protein [Rhizobium jaguaris]AYG60003.1 hypothetical protein CCGE525_15185 [Rhizobium jaguaris]